MTIATQSPCLMIPMGAGRSVDSVHVDERDSLRGQKRGADASFEVPCHRDLPGANRRAHVCSDTVRATAAKPCIPKIAIQRMEATEARQRALHGFDSGRVARPYPHFLQAEDVGFAERPPLARQVPLASQPGSQIFNVPGDYAQQRSGFS